MKAVLLSGLILMGLSGCSSTNESNEQNSYSKLSVVEGALLAKEWQQLNRFPPKFPVSHAMKGEDGCATIEYVVSSDNQVSNLQVVNSTSKHFAKQAKINVKKWHWSKLPKGITKTPVKTQTQFQFCVDPGDGRCSKQPRITQCSGEDVIYAVGYRVRRG